MYLTFLKQIWQIRLLSVGSGGYLLPGPAAAPASPRQHSPPPAQVGYQGKPGVFEMCTGTVADEVITKEAKENARSQIYQSNIYG